MLEADAVRASPLRISVMRLSRRLRLERTDDDLTLTQLAVLATLDRHGPLTLGELADHEKVQPPSMTRIVASSRRPGWSPHARTPPTGGRSWSTLTDAGRERAARTTAAAATPGSRSGSPTSPPDERDVLREARRSSTGSRTS